MQSNAPATYAKFILAYVAAGRSDLVSHAGSGSINLRTKLLSYQDLSDGHFSPLDPGMYAAVNTTTWAVLALKAIGETGSDFTGAVAWLKQQQGADGGFPSEPGDADDVDDTAAAIQALRAGGLGTGSQVVTDALAYLHARQRADGGFPDYPSDGRSYAESTAWVIQALIATGQDPQSWNKGSHTPVDVPVQLAGVFGGFPAPARPVGDGAAHDLRGGHRPVRQEVPLRVHRVRLQAAVQAAVHLGVAEARHGAAQYAVRAGAGPLRRQPRRHRDRYRQDQRARRHARASADPLT